MHVHHNLNLLLSLTSITSSHHAMCPLSTYHYTTQPHTSSSLMWEFTSKQYHAMAFPQLIGRWHTHDATHEELYSASLLTLFKSWNALADLDTLGISVQESLAVFLSSDGCACKDQVDNIKYVHSMGFLAIQIHLHHLFCFICYIPLSYNLLGTQWYIDGQNFETHEIRLEGENSITTQHELGAKKGCSWCSVKTEILKKSTEVNS